MFNNKFGTGILKHPGYNIGGGFGEAALMGALIGGGTSLLTGSNPLTGALLGGLSGGAMEGIGGLMGTAEGATKDALLASATENSLPAGVTALDTSVVDAGGVLSANPAIANQAMSGVGNTIAGSGMVQGAGGTFFDPQYLADNPALAGTAQGATSAANAANTAANQGIAGVAQKPGMFAQAKEWYGNLKPWEKAGVGIAGGVGLHEIMKPPELLDPNIGKSNYKGPALHDLSPDFQGYTATPNVYQAHYAQGGIAGLDGQSPMALGMGGNQGFPGGRLDSTQYATPTQMPTSTPVVNSGYEQRTNPYTGEPQGFAFGGDVDSDDVTAAAPSVENTAAKVLGASPVNNMGIAGFATGGGIGSLGGYAAGGNPRLLNGPGDGMSDSIPATIGHKQPARLADGEFVVPADVVSHLGNGSTDAGAKHLYAMMDKVRAARTGNKKQSKQINPNKFLPA